MREWFFAGEECGQASGGPGSPAAALATSSKRVAPGTKKGKVSLLDRPDIPLNGRAPAEVGLS